MLLASLFSFSVVAQNLYYTVLVGNFIDAKPQDFDNIRNLGFLVGNQMNGNQYQVQMVGYETKSEAEKIAQRLRNKGYSSAYVQEVPITQGQTEIVIQFATRNLGKEIEWEEFEKVGPLFAILSGSQIKIVTGTYTDANTAKRQLTNVRNMGYSDAFIKRVNTVFLHPVSEFGTGIKKPLIPITFNQNQPTTTVPQMPATPYGSVPERTATPIPGAYDVVTPRSPVAVNPASPVYASTKGAATALPEIRATVKRTSALELQKVLKANNVYTGKLDGYYGNGTATAYEAMMAGNRELQKYKLLGEMMDFNTATAISPNRLQQAINSLHSDPAAPNTIKSSYEPIARAYEAYVSFLLNGPSTIVNNTMNLAIRDAFSNTRFSGPPPFDYQATYAYQDLGQLIQHIHYIHSAPSNNYTAPCWFFERHPQETARAYESVARMATANFNLKGCDRFLAWEEIKTLTAIASDLNGDLIMDQGKLADGSARRTRLLLYPQQMTPSEISAFENWNGVLWNRLNSWALRDPLHNKMVSALKVVYLQSQVRLEDYYMDKGFNTQQASGLALATLQSLVGYHLERFSI